MLLVAGIILMVRCNLIDMLSIDDRVVLPTVEEETNQLLDIIVSILDYTYLYVCRCVLRMCVRGMFVCVCASKQALERARVK